MLYWPLFLFDALAALVWLLLAAFVQFGPTNESAIAMLVLPWGGLVGAAILRAKGQSIAALVIAAALFAYNVYWLFHLR